MTTLLDDAELEGSSVSANRAMNRERRLRGGNGYAKELGFDVFDFLRARLNRQPEVCWVDLCCGTARALSEAAELFSAAKLDQRVSICGVDLVDFFHPSARAYPCISLQVDSVHRWRPPRDCDLITCVHGLHYLGDKMAVVSNAVRHLRDDGRFVGHLDLHNLRFSGGRSSARQLTRSLRDQGIEYSSRHHRLLCEGRRDVEFPFRYLGADDRTGPNYTGQNAVTSHYG